MTSSVVGVPSRVFTLVARDDRVSMTPRYGPRVPFGVDVSGTGEHR